MTKLEQLAHLLSSAWYHGSWKAETPNEQTMENLMCELGYWPTTEDEIVLRGKELHPEDFRD